MTRTCKSFRDEACAALKGNWGLAVGATLIYIILYGAFNAGAELSVGFGSVICYLLVLLIGIPLEWGYSIMFLPLVRQEGKLDLGMLFDGFKDYGRIFLTLLLMSVYVFLWALLLLVPGFIKAYSYSMTPYILKDRPDLKYNAAIEESMRMMRGNKMKLFLLDLSFIGWALLCILTLGIGLLWLEPYTVSARAAFYEELKRLDAESMENADVAGTFQGVSEETTSLE